MTDKKIGELTEGTFSSGGDKLIFETSGGETRKLLLGNFAASDMSGSYTPSDRILIQKNGVPGYLIIGSIGGITQSALNSGDVILFKRNGKFEGIAYGALLGLLNSEYLPTVSGVKTLAADSWEENTGFYKQDCYLDVDTAKRNVVDITASEAPLWREHGIYAYSQSADKITFRCESVPSGDLTFRLTSFKVSGGGFLVSG